MGFVTALDPAVSEGGETSHLVLASCPALQAREIAYILMSMAQSKSFLPDCYCSNAGFPGGDLLLDLHNGIPKWKYTYRYKNVVKHSIRHTNEQSKRGWQMHFLSLSLSLSHTHTHIHTHKEREREEGGRERLWVFLPPRG